MSAHRRTGREEGLSLIEMMVGMLIVGIVLAALASSLVTSLRAVRGQETTTLATAALNDLLEEAQRVDYDHAALCDTTATTHFGGTTFEGEDLILSSAVCGTADEVPPARTVTVGGTDYAISTAITWADDEGDGLGAADSDTTQDVKRIIVDVTWTADGRTRTARNIAFRAPQFLEQLVTAEVVADDGSEFVTIDDDAIDDGENDEAFTVRAFAREKLSSVSVEWVDRNGAVESHPMTEKSADVWEYNLHSNFGPFANGGTLFTLDATAASGETEQVNARGLFLYDPMVILADATGSQIQRDFEKITIGADDGAVCPGHSLWVDVEGAIRSDVADATWLKGPATPDSLVSVEAPDDVAKRGARFLLDLSDRTDFSTANGDGTYSAVATQNQVRVSVTRIVDSAIIAKELDNIAMETVPTC